MEVGIIRDAALYSGSANQSAILFSEIFERAI
jgi:hypothetical protein